MESGPALGSMSRRWVLSNSQAIEYGLNIRSQRISPGFHPPSARQRSRPSSARLGPLDLGAAGARPARPPQRAAQ